MRLPPGGLRGPGDEKLRMTSPTTESRMHPREKIVREFTPRKENGTKGEVSSLQESEKSLPGRRKALI